MNQSNASTASVNGGSYSVQQIAACGHTAVGNLAKQVWHLWGRSGEAELGRELPFLASANGDELPKTATAQRMAGATPISCAVADRQPI
jgi:hypothetical protein